MADVDMTQLPAFQIARQNMIATGGGNVQPPPMTDPVPMAGGPVGNPPAPSGRQTYSLGDFFSGLFNAAPANAPVRGAPRSATVQERAAPAPAPVTTAPGKPYPSVAPLAQKPTLVAPAAAPQLPLGQQAQQAQQGQQNPGITMGQLLMLSKMLPVMQRPHTYDDQLSGMGIAELGRLAQLQAQPGTQAQQKAVFDRLSAIAAIKRGASGALGVEFARPSFDGTE